MSKTNELVWILESAWFHGEHVGSIYAGRNAMYAAFWMRQQRFEIPYPMNQSFEAARAFIEQEWQSHIRAKWILLNE